MAKKEISFTDQIQDLLLMETKYLKEYGCYIYRVVEEKGRLYRTVNANGYGTKGNGIPVKKVKSLDHFIKLMEGEGFSVLDEDIHLRYYNKVLDKV